MQLSDKIKKIRKERKISQEQLAARCGVSQSAISAIERGDKNPTIDTLEMIAKGLRIKTSDLLSDETEKKPADDLSGLDEELITLLVNLPDLDVQRVKDFVQGMKASRGE